MLRELRREDLYLLLFSFGLMYLCLNRAIRSRKCSIKAPAKWRNSLYVLTLDGDLPSKKSMIGPKKRTWNIALPKMVLIKWLITNTVFIFLAFSFESRFINYRKVLVWKQNKKEYGLEKTALYVLICYLNFPANFSNTNLLFLFPFQLPFTDLVMPLCLLSMLKVRQICLFDSELQGLNLCWYWWRVELIIVLSCFKLELSR